MKLIENCDIGHFQYLVWSIKIVSRLDFEAEIFELYCKSNCTSPVRENQSSPFAVETPPVALIEAILAFITSFH